MQPFSDAFAQAPFIAAPQDELAAPARPAALVPPLHWHTQPDGTFALAEQPGWRAYTGQRATTSAGWGWLDAVYPADRTHSRQVWQAGTNPFTVQQRILGADGAYRLFLTQAQPLFAEPATLGGWDCTSMDIGQVRAEQSAILGAVAESVVIFDREGNIREMNPAALKSFAQVVPPDYAALPLAQRLQQARMHDAEGEPLVGERSPIIRVLRGDVLAGPSAVDVFVTTFDGREVALSFSGAPLRDERGAITGAVVIVRDITDRLALERRTQDALDALLAMAEALVQGTADGNEATAVAQRLATLTCRVLGCARVAISVIDPTSDHVRSFAVAGLTPDQEAQWWAHERAQSQHLSDITEPHFVARLQAGETLHFDMTEPPYNSQPNPYNVRDVLIAPLNAGTRLVGWLALDYGAMPHVFTRDERRLAGAVGKLLALVIEQARLRREREAARADALALATAQRQMDEFLSIASHELRTPLTTIKANFQLTERALGAFLATHPAIDPKLARTHELLSRTDQHIARLDRLVEDLLDVSRIQAGKLSLRRELCDLAQLVGEAVEEQRLVASDRTITLALPDAPVAVVADPGRINQVITNFLTNALKYSPPESTVQVRLRGEARAARVEVTDAGPGLPRAEQRHVWERFHRAPGVAVQYGSGVGLGLGLFICRTIIERHGGRVGIISTKGRGATFWFQLPLAEPPPARPPRHRP